MDEPCGIEQRSQRPGAGPLVRLRCAGLVAVLALTGCNVPEPQSDPRSAAQADPLARRYEIGETIRYSMAGAHEGPQATTRYTAESEGVVRQREDGAFFEDTRWVRLAVDGVSIDLDAGSAAFRQQLSLDPRFEMPVPDVAGVSPRLVGPIFDLMTFYVDLHPSLREGHLAVAGDGAFVAHGAPNSWADGTFVLVGEDCIDFDLTLIELGERDARLRVAHVPPKTTSVRLPAAWMRDPITASPNNWVQVTRDGSGGFQAAVGSETFDVDLSIARPSGRIEHATMNNPVDFVMRACKDEALTDCGDPIRGRIHRRIELRSIDGSR